MNDSVAITGMGVICSLGTTKDSIEASIRSGKRPFAPIKRFDGSNYIVNLAAEVPSLQEQASYTVPPYSSRTDVLALAAASTALEEAQISVEQRENLGIILGASSGGMAEIEEAFLKDPIVGVAHTYVRNPVWATANNVCTGLNLGGSRATYMTACSSAAHALGLAMRRLRQGETDRILAGGAESLCRLTMAGFGSLGVLDEHGTRPLCTERNGINLGEGAAFFVLEKASTARARNIPILGYILGYSGNSEAHHMVHPRDDGSGAKKAMQEALINANLCPSEIDYVNAHGTGTKQNDAMESLAITDLFGAHSSTKVASSKSQVGHTLGAAGAIEAALIVLGMQRNFIPPSVGITSQLPQLDAHKLIQDAGEKSSKVAISSSFAFGGNNASLVLSKNRPVSIPPAKDSMPIRISAANIYGPHGLYRKSTEFVQLLEHKEPMPSMNWEGLNPSHILGSRATRRMDSLSAHVTALSKLATDDAGIENCSEYAVGFGSAYGALDATLKFLGRLFEKGPRLVNPLEFPNLVHNAPPSYISIHHGAMGPAIAASQDIISGDEALRSTVSFVQSGDCPGAIIAAGELHSVILNRGYDHLTKEQGFQSKWPDLACSLVVESTTLLQNENRDSWATLLGMHPFGNSSCLESEVEAFLQKYGLSPESLDRFFWAGSSSLQPSFQALPSPTNTEAFFGHTGASGLATIAVGAAAIKEKKAKNILIATLATNGYGQLTLLGQ